MDVDRFKRRSGGSHSKVLQWSHVLMDVDRATPLKQREVRGAASMEPRPDGRG